MSNYYHTSSRRSPSELQSSTFIQSTDKGGRTVLPPLSTAFPTSLFPVVDPYSAHYVQPRSSPGRAAYDPSSMYGHYNNSIPATAHYDPDYTLQGPYNTFNTPRSSTHHSYDNAGSRRHFTSSSTSYGVDDSRWPNQSYHTTTPHAALPNNSAYAPSVPSYPLQYASTTAPAHHHQQQQDMYPYDLSSHDSYHHASSHYHHHSSEPRTSSPHTRAAAATSSRPVARAPSPPRSSVASSPTSPTYPGHYPEASQDTATKKKRRRADANQLKILNEVWERTAFPSTEERAELAKRLDMSPRSVQIWFQNKRQSLRQTNRQSTSMTTSSHQPFVVSPAPNDDSYIDDVPSNQYHHHSSSAAASMAYSMPVSSSHHRSSQSPTVPYRRSRS